MKKLLLTLSLLFTITIGVLAQSNIRDEVHLKNGSIIKGEVLGYEGEPENTIKIQTSDGSIFVFKMSEVLNVKKITNDVKKYSVRTNTKEKYIEEGYKGFFETGFSFGVGTYGSDFFSATTSHGYQFNPYIFLGAGVGINIYTEGYGTPISVPVFVNPRFNLLDNFITPYLDLKIGYSFVDTKNFYFNPAIGGSFTFNKQMGMNFSLGYTMQLLKWAEYDYYSGWREGTITSSGIMLRVGLEF